MRLDAYLDQCITGRTVASRRAAFALQTQNLTVAHPRWNIDVQRGAVRKDN